MSGEPNELEKFVEEVLKKLMADRPISKGVQASSTSELQASPLTGHHYGRVNPGTKQRSKHRDDLANVKQILLILPEYIPPLAGDVNCDNIPQYFEYIMVTVYILKGIHIVGS
jgi:hypothetical protein